jgi:hypothetical protein
MWISPGVNSSLEASPVLPYDMKLMNILLWTLLSLVDVAKAQTVPNPSRCVANSGVTAFPACEYVYNEFSTCSAYAAASSAYQYFNCYCQQKYFNALFDCDSEERLCLGTGELVDSHLSQQVSFWHSECDDKVNYTPTTPIISSITASYNIDYCNTVKLNCNSLTQERVLCDNIYQTGPAASLTSCLCQPPLLTLAYDCSILGNVSCIQVPAALTNMAEYEHCSNLNAVLTLPPSVVSTTFGS